MISFNVDVRIPHLRLALKKEDGKVCKKTLREGDYIRFSTSETTQNINLWFVGKLTWIHCKLTWGVFFTDGPITLAEHYVLLSNVNDIDKVSRKEFNLDEEKKTTNSDALKFYYLLMGKA